MRNGNSVDSLLLSFCCLQRARSPFMPHSIGTCWIVLADPSGNLELIFSSQRSLLTVSLLLAGTLFEREAWRSAQNRIKDATQPSCSIEFITDLRRDRDLLKSWADVFVLFTCSGPLQTAFVVHGGTRDAQKSEITCRVAAAKQLHSGFVGARV